MLKLLFFLLQVSLSTSLRCSPNATLFQRVPTAANNFTKHWCLEFVPVPDDLKKNDVSLTYREYSRSICIGHNSTISSPENQNEMDFISKQYENVPKKMIMVAIDGEMNPRCRAEFYRRRQKDVYFKNETGDCNIKKAFMFDDVNTDPTFVYSILVDRPGNFGSRWFAESRIYDVGTCMFAWKNANQTAFVTIAYCNGDNQSHDDGTYTAGVVCGSHAQH